MIIGLLELRKHLSLLLLQLLRQRVDVLRLTICLRNPSLVKVRGGLIVKLIGGISRVLCSLFHLVEFLGVSLLVLSDFHPILVDILPYLLLELLDLRPSLSIVIMDIQLVSIDIIFSGRSMVVDALSILHFFIVHLLIHILFHHELLLLYRMHLSNKVGLSLRVSNPLLRPLLLLAQLDQPGLKGDLLMSHHFQVVLRLHHLGLRALNAYRTHARHQHLGI